ncbi:hypothetical protein [Streptomyces aureoverticillatus]|uniref:hypothetical protein n=1 Tax=Streptomyces aureoverticillatus TaxID=66871 RepID=UPI0013DA5C7A|nr:hypothetical protein [Streptomyces aureoverticillatus]QIB49471.1 hypothetical protein G3H79_40555 [Streptomyces aureoverticillatus]
MQILSRLREWAENSVGAAESPDAVVVKTTRYLRLLMVALVIGLATAIIYEHWQSHMADGGGGRCWQTSISAYYYTPVQLMFVGGLVAIGISLIALKGSTELEDVFLNCAGILAPVVAFVPTPNVGQCGSVLTDTANRSANIDNNVLALLVMAGATFLVLILLKLLKKPVTDVPGQTQTTGANEMWARRITAIGFVLALAFYTAAGFAFWLDREWFSAHAHWSAAITMFVFIFLAVFNNAINFHFTQKRNAENQSVTDGAGEAETTNILTRFLRFLARLAKPFNWYLLIALLMGLSLVLTKVWPRLGGDHSTLWLEASMILLFAMFWVIQTRELWNHGLRTPEPESP